MNKRSKYSYLVAGVGSQSVWNEHFNRVHVVELNWLMANTGKAIELVITVFLCGVAFGAEGMHTWQLRMLSQQRHRNVINELRECLLLTADQEKQFDAIIADLRSQKEALDEQERAEWTSLSQSSFRKFRMVLDSEQQTKLDAFVKHLDEHERKESTPRGCDSTCCPEVNVKTRT